MCTNWAISNWGTQGHPATCPRGSRDIWQMPLAEFGCCPCLEMAMKLSDCVQTVPLELWSQYSHGIISPVRLSYIYIYINVNHDGDLKHIKKEIEINQRKHDTMTIHDESRNLVSKWRVSHMGNPIFGTSNWGINQMKSPLRTPRWPIIDI